MFETLKAECDLEMQKKSQHCFLHWLLLAHCEMFWFIFQVPLWADTQVITVFSSVKLSSLFMMFRPTLLLMCRLPLN